MCLPRCLTASKPSSMAQFLDIGCAWNHLKNFQNSQCPAHTHCNYIRNSREGPRHKHFLKFPRQSQGQPSLRPLQWQLSLWCPDCTRMLGYQNSAAASIYHSLGEVSGLCRQPTWSASITILDNYWRNQRQGQNDEYFCAPIPSPVKWGLNHIGGHCEN